MKKQPLDKRSKLLGVIGLTLVIMVGLWFGLISPQTDKLKAMRDRKAAAARKLQQVNTALGNAPAVKIQLNKELGVLNQLEGKMASGDLNSWAFNTIREFKAPYKIDIPQFGRIEGPKDVNLIPKFPYKQVTLTVAGMAEYFELGRFIADFENEFPYSRIANLSLEPATTAQNVEPERLAFKMEVIALVKPSNS